MMKGFCASASLRANAGLVRNQRTARLVLTPPSFATGLPQILLATRMVASAHPLFHSMATAPFMCTQRRFYSRTVDKDDELPDEDKMITSYDIKRILLTRKLEDIPVDIKKKYGEEAVLNIWAQFDEQQRRAKSKRFSSLLADNLESQNGNAPPKKPGPYGKQISLDDDMPQYEKDHENLFWWLAVLTLLFIAYRNLVHEKLSEKANLDPEEYLFSDLSVNYLKKLPTGYLSRCWGYMNTIAFPFFIQTPINRLYAYACGCNLEEAEKEVGEYKTLGDFFCRNLKPGLRPIQEDSLLVSPVDGKIVHYGLIDTEFDEMEQIKGVSYSLSEFLGENSPLVEKIRERKKNGNSYQREATDFYYCVIYLAPGDYHGYHSPVDWVINQRNHFPGHLFPVNYGSVSRIRGVLALNERVVLSGEWRYGEFSYTPVGAYNVGSMDLSFDEELVTNTPNPPTPEKIYTDKVVSLKGDNIGFFHLGSTVVLVFEAPKMLFMKARGQKVKMGEQIAVKLTPELAAIQKKRIEAETIILDTMYKKRLEAISENEMKQEKAIDKERQKWEQYKVNNEWMKAQRQNFYPKVDPEEVQALQQKKNELRASLKKTTTETTQQ